MASLNGEESEAGVQSGEGPGEETSRPADDRRIPPYGKAQMSCLEDHLEEQLVVEGRVLLVVDHGENGGLKTPVVFEHDGRVSGITHIAVADDMDIDGLNERARAAATEWKRDTGADDDVDVSVDNVTLHLKLVRTLVTVINAVNNRAILRASQEGQNAFAIANGPGSSGTGTCSSSLQMKRLAEDEGIAVTATVTCKIEKEGLTTVEVVTEEHLRVPKLNI